MQCMKFEPEKLAHQLVVRVGQDVYVALQAKSRQMGHSPSALVRLILEKSLVDRVDVDQYKYDILINKMEFVAMALEDKTGLCSQEILDAAKYYARLGSSVPKGSLERPKLRIRADESLPQNMCSALLDDYSLESSERALRGVAQGRGLDVGAPPKRDSPVRAQVVGLTPKHALLQIDQRHGMLVKLSDMTGKVHLGERIELTRDR